MSKHTPETIDRHNLVFVDRRYEMKLDRCGEWVRYDDVKPLIDALAGRDPAALERLLIYADAVVESWHEDEIGQLDELQIENLAAALAAFRAKKEETAR